MDEEGKSQTKRSITRDISRIGNFFQVSSCNLTVKEWEARNIAPSSDGVLQKHVAKRHLLLQLQTLNYIPLQLAFQEYLGMLPQNLHPRDPVHASSLRSFVDSILSRNNGIPVMIVNITQSDRYLVLYGNRKIGDLHHLTAIDEILTKHKASNNENNRLEELAGHIEGLMKLVCSSREYAMILCILSYLLPHTTIRHKLNFSEDKLLKFRNICQSLMEDAENKEKDYLDSAKEQVEDCLQKLENDLQMNNDNFKKMSQKENDTILIENLHQDTENVKERLKRTRKRKDEMAKAIASRKFKLWKEGILRQKGKGKGNYRIDRGAEKAVFGVLQEQLVAHSRRKGVPAIERRLQRKELRYIANEFLISQGKRLIKSFETVRSWSVPRNKRSIQSKQHRGEGLYCHRKPQKKYVEEHINIHYNRAFVKNYTRFLFSQQNRDKYQDYALRRCIDDKAYLRCGTSEGFGRPANTPITIKEHQASLPAYDFPEKIGYIAPGVNLIIKDMEEISRENQRSKYALRDSKILVTCKPKAYYPSSATNWANDLYTDRIENHEEHEIPLVTPTDINVPRNILSSLILLKDSSKQFSIMTIEDDYLKSLKGGSHLERELLRVSVIICRLLFAYEKVVLNAEIEKMVGKHILDATAEAQGLELYLKSVKLNKDELCRWYVKVCSKLQDIEDTLNTIVPNHRSIDVQTSDAGPGVGTSEGMVRLRLVESFLIHDLDFQCRIHYAPRDSKCHKVEQVMSYLTDAAGDGRHIWPETKSLLDCFSTEELMNMPAEDQKSHEEKLQRKIAFKCATEVVWKYEGKPAMNTTIHAKVSDTDNNPYQHFYFDEVYLKKCIDTTKKAIPDCAGYAYYEFLKSKFDEIYIRYDNGVEGIRKDNEFRCPNDIQRIPPPVPDLETESEKGEWHYHIPSSLPEEYKHVEKRQVNDFCPRAQLQSMVASLGPVNLVEKKDLSGSIKVVDENQVWDRLNDALPNFIQKYTGKDLEDNVRMEAKKLYLRQLQRQKTKFSKNKKNLVHEYQSILDCTGIKLTLKRNQQMPRALPWNGLYNGKELINTCTADNFLFFFHCLQRNKPTILIEMENSPLHCLQLINKIHKAFQNQNYAEGKYIWFKQFERFDEGDDVWDAFGSEDELFLTKLWEITSISYTSVCDENTGRCRSPIKIRQARTLYFRLPEAGAQSFEDGVKLWLKNEEDTVCQEVLEGSVNDTCGSVRHMSVRSFISGQHPLVLPFEISYCPYTKLPSEMQINGKSYYIGLLTFGNGGHFCSKINITGQWLHYDGLREYHSSGDGLKNTKKPFNPPPGYRKNYVVYYRN